MFRATLIFFSSMAISITAAGQQGACDSVKQKLAFLNAFIKDSVFVRANSAINAAAKLDYGEHCIAFGKDSLLKYSVSGITNGSSNSSAVPAVVNAFSDLHNHNNNLPPDAGDVYGLITICKKNPSYDTRFVLTASGNLYALLIKDRKAAIAFADSLPPQKPVLPGMQPAFPEKIVDESRELKYSRLDSDEHILSYILKKYNTGIFLIKVNYNSEFVVIDW